MWNFAVLFSLFLCQISTAAIDSPAFHSQMSAGQISAEFLEKCPHASPNSYSPSCPLMRKNHYGINPDICSTTNISIGLWLERFHGIDDVTETLSISGSVHYYWNITCNYTLPYGDDYILFYQNGSLFWKPKIYHQNAVSDYGMELDFADRFSMEKVIDPIAPKAGLFYLQHSGVFESTGDMDFSNFPFDQEQTLYMIFLVRELPFAARFTDFDIIDYAPDFMPPGAGWSFIKINYTITSTEILGKPRSTTVFALRFRRRPDFFVWNLMLPCCLLTSIELASVFMPSRFPERAIFTVTILLALTVIQADVLERIPAKPQRIFLSNYTDLCSLLAWAYTVYALVSCAFAESPTTREWIERNIRWAPIPIRIMRFMDAAALVVGLALFAAINIYAIAVAKNSHYL